VPSDTVIEVVSKANAVMCSQFIRSHASAKLLNIPAVTYSDSIFNEAGLPIAHWMFPPLSVRIWTILFRLLWLMGYFENSESLNQARGRATRATDKLIELVARHNSIVFIGRAIINRMIANRLREQKWSGPKKTNSTYWCFTEFKK